MKTLKIQNNPDELQAGKILCLGSNYAKHIKEMKNEPPESPILFFKPPSSIIRENEDIIIPRISSEPHYEAELIVVIGKRGKKIPAQKANDYILGYGVGLDMTLRDLQNAAKTKGLPWSVAKGFDTSAPVSEIITGIKDPQKLQIRCKLNGEIRQNCSTGEMIFPVNKIIEFASSIFTLERGDIIFTGTPEGVGVVKDGDIIEIELVGHVKARFKVKYDTNG